MGTTSVFRDIDRRGRLDGEKIKSFGDEAVGVRRVDTVVTGGVRGCVWGSVDGLSARTWERFYMWVNWAAWWMSCGVVWWFAVKVVRLLVRSLAGSGAGLGVAVDETLLWLLGWVESLGERAWLQYRGVFGLPKVVVSIPFVAALWWTHATQLLARHDSVVRAQMLEHTAVKLLVGVLLYVAGWAVEEFGTPFVGCVALVASVTAAMLYYPVSLLVVERHRGRIPAVVLLLRLLVSSPLGLLGLLICELAPAPREGAVPASVTQISQLDNVIADAVYRNTGLSIRGALHTLTAEQLQAVGSVNQGAPETAVVRRMAYVGDRVMALALAERALREEWPVGRSDALAQTVLTNAAFARYVDATLSKAFPKVVSRSEKRKGTLLEALVGMYYASTHSVQGVEDFVFGRIVPLVPGGV